MDALIEDPWRRFDCSPSPDGCVVAFEDPDFAAAGRDVVYYARALQEQTPAINAAYMRTSFDAQGNAISVDPCYGCRAHAVGAPLRDALLQIIWLASVRDR